ncbi:SGNH/GDSL hydrolase family protein [Paraglaciecola aquimarina]|uniref:SGNH/GDSL hydrolase family protein n=1 Tax=Paraglaciecola algarum TaxID=3050085 RepID=A0ABS9D594_9ALTE|nr:SGNH/GDSL hydrolase family protein [Paraglaciecola sp. G1-23]MCF2948106.1 SGNH/GDSL hydrolase family protein [Paraglaciecola sp. G1-23]
MKNNILEVVGLITPGRYQKIQCRDYPPNKHYRLKPPADKVADSNGHLDDTFFTMQTDENGFIGLNKESKKTTAKVYFLGGSTTECIWNNADVRWPTRVATDFNKRCNSGIKINCFNSGVWGNTTAQSVNLLINKILPLKPNCVVMMHNINDLVLMIHESDYWKAHTPSRKILARSAWDAMPSSMMRKVYLNKKINKLKRIVGDLLGLTENKNDEFAKVRNLPSKLDEKTYLKQFTDNLHLFIFTCRLKHVHPILMTQASRLKDNPDNIIREHVETMMKEKGLSYEKVSGYFNSLNNCIRQVAAELNVTLIDLESAIPKTEDMMFDSVHFTDKGCITVASHIADELFKLQIFDSKS